MLMRKFFSFLSFITVFSFLFFSMALDSASAVTFRRPLNTILSPMVSYHYDDNAGSGAYRYTCSTSSVYNNHRGTDFRATVGTPIYAGAYGALYYRIDGCPTYGYLGSSCGGGFGNHVRMDHEGAADGIGWVTIYAHMQNGTPIGAGTFFCSTNLGLTGSSGSSTGPHLHFEVRKYAYPNNDPFAGACSGPVSFWSGISSTDIPSTVCSS